MHLLGSPRFWSASTRSAGDRRSLRVGARLACAALAGLSVTAWPTPSAARPEQAPSPIVWAPQPAPGLSAERALRNALQQIADLPRKSWPAAGIVLQLPPGLVRLETTLLLNSQHSGLPGAPLVIQGDPQQGTILSGARAVVLRPASQMARTLLTPDAQRQIWSAPLPADWPEEALATPRQGQGIEAASSASELFHLSRPMPRAAWPNQGFATIDQVRDQGREISVRNAPQSASGWPAESQLRIHGYWRHDWADEWIPGTASSGHAAWIRLAEPAPRYGVQPGQRVRIVDAQSELDQPGEWFLDTRTRTLLFWPPVPPEPGDVELSLLTNVLEIKGASHVLVRDLLLEGARGDAVVVSGGQQVTLERLRVRNAGGLGIRMGGRLSRIVDCHIHDTGQGGLQLWAGDRNTLQPGELVAEGNRIEWFNRIVRTYRPAILIGGVGNTARGNLIAQGTHSGIQLHGNDHLVEFNVLHDLATETGDVGAIYSGNDWTARGNVIRHNVLHHIQGPGRYGSRGVYLDDQASGFHVEGNVFYRVDRAVFIGGGRDNLVEGNLFVASSPGIHLDARGRTWQKDLTDSPEGSLRKGLAKVPWQTEPYLKRYPGLATLLQDAPGHPRGNVARRNLAVGGQPFHFLDGAQHDLLIEGQIPESAFAATEHPGVTDKSWHTLEPGPDSPLHRSGFPALPWRRMKCTEQRWLTAAPLQRAPRPTSCDGMGSRTTEVRP